MVLPNLSPHIRGTNEWCDMPPPVYVYFNFAGPRRPIAHTTATITSVAPTPAPNRIALSIMPEGPPLGVVVGCVVVGCVIASLVGVDV